MSSGSSISEESNLSLLLEIRFDVCSKSNSVGPYHLENQDSYLADSRNLTFAVADGVGGYSGAKEASSFAINYLAKNSKSISDQHSLAECIQEIHRKILEISKKLQFPNMGTTLAFAKLLPEKQSYLVANVGDSPILMLEGDSLLSVYFDDSYRSKDPSSIYGITQYLGVDFPIKIHTSEISLKRDSVLLLCSDGITDNLLVNRGASSKLVSLIKSQSAERIVDAAIREGLKPDDMTAVLVFL
jgi:PPM family protein phosphatase